MKRPTKLPYSPIIGIVAVLFYAVVAGVVANQITRLDVQRSVVEDFALGHFITVPILLLVGIWFVKYASWETEVWTTKPPGRTGYRKKWLWVFPVLALAQCIITLSVAPWSELNFLFILTILTGTLLLAIGEEMYFRGILRASLSKLKNELSVVLLTALFFGLGHSFGAFYDGTPIGTILFHVSILSIDAIGFYAILKATGTLWVPIFLHFLTDFSLYVGSGMEGGTQGSSTVELPPLSGIIAIVSVAASLIFLFAVLRHDWKEHRKQVQGGENR